MEYFNIPCFKSISVVWGYLCVKLYRFYMLKFDEYLYKW